MNRAQAFALGQFIIGGGLMLAFVVMPRTASDFYLALGLLDMAIGAAVILAGIWEHRRVNRNLPTIVPTPNAEAQLVTSGVYAYIRHPLYTGVIVIALGACILHGHWSLWLVALALAAWMNAKASYEEALLRETYPQYATYMQTTGRFVPRLQ